MYPIYISLFLTGVDYLMDSLGNTKKPFYQYLALFFLTAGVNFLFTPKEAHAEYENRFAESYFAENRFKAYNSLNIILKWRNIIDSQEDL